MNKVIAFFSDENGDVAQDIVQKLKDLSPDNSKGDLSIEKCLQESEKAFFDKVHKDKICSAASIICSKRESTWGAFNYEHARRQCPGAQLLKNFFQKEVSPMTPRFFEIVRDYWLSGPLAYGVVGF